MPRRTAVSFTQRLQPADQPTPGPPAPEALEDIPEATENNSPATSQSGAATPKTNPDLLMSLLETFLTTRQCHVHPASAFGSYVDGSLRSLPPAIRRAAEARIMEVLHHCQNDADRLRTQTSFREEPAQRQGCRPRESPFQQWQPHPSQWPAEVTNPSSVWNSMDRPWVQEQFPDMNIACPLPNNGKPSQPSSSTEVPSAVDMQDMYSQMRNSDSFSSLLGHINNSLANPAQDRKNSDA